jgi:hypothetical protein
METLQLGMLWRAYIDSAGNVGIGTSSPLTGLSLSRSGTQWTNNSSNTYPVPAGRTFVQMEAVAAQANWFGFTGAYGATSGSANLLLQVNLNNTSQQAGNYIASEAQSATAADLTFGKMVAGATTGANSAKSEQMRITSAGNVGIGTTSPDAKLDVTSTGSASAYTVSAVIQDGNYPASGNPTLEFNGFIGGNGYRSGVGSIGGQSLAFYTPSTYGVAPTERLRQPVAYNTSSDYRLKEDWVAVADASTRVNALKPVNFAWKVDGSRVDGFLAHELAEVVPEAVTGEKDAVDAEGNPVYQGIDQSKLVPLLTAALQEALAFKTLEILPLILYLRLGMVAQEPSVCASPAQVTCWWGLRQVLITILQKRLRKAQTYWAFCHPPQICNQHILWACQVLAKMQPQPQSVFVKTVQHQGL